MRSLRDHLDHPTLGTPPAGEATEGCAGGSCGVLARFFLEVDPRGVIRDVSARVRGRAAAFATASALCEAARGRTVLAAAGLGLLTLHPSFDAMDDADRERALVVEDAFHHALGTWVTQRAAAGEVGVLDSCAAPRALVAMSGGVDSAVTLREVAAVERGAVAGVTLRLWIDPAAPDPEAACCSPDSVRRARATCHDAGVPHLSIDLRRAFTRAVVVPFVAQYAAGETPNPCTRCNGDFRLDELVRVADALGAATIATGHYARLQHDAPGSARIRRGADLRKDQSYMLCMLTPATAARMRFPLGERTKPEVRERAAELGLAQATVPDSQDVCFLGGGDYRSFLARAGALGRAGEVRDESGRVHAAHDGIARFTPGQRRGLGASIQVDGGAPAYVLDTDPATGTVTVGAAARLLRTTVMLRDARALVTPAPARASAQLRYRAGGHAVPATIRWLEGDAAELELDEPVRAPAAGQVACLYDDDGVVVATGTIARTPLPPRA